ncbi:flagella basal body P-ring formation protein FlgA [Sphingomonas laterariae]|uniref:Flagella basal body P-ring formation protein FlgA n=1 Tax=Edaphosphingomonas laterariae TaxID=861865 RepID=A0A239HT92_9SPHN|nr:flagella basal body P-ring formation protein FlgA [Sphingomonas laterariae]SNS84556.1 flagella basal body P-ring formation protein FlgA [Sphingomonas laterariae]
MQRNLTLIGLTLAMACPAYAQVGRLENLDALERRLVISLGADIGQPGGPVAPLDRRMKLAACPGAAVIEPPVAGAAVLRCVEIGWRIRVPVAAGGTIRQAQAMPAARPARQAPVIRRGDPVEIRAEQAGFVVSNQVIAEQDGAPGERIRVRSGVKSAPIMVEVVDFGVVRVPGI